MESSSWLLKDKVFGRILIGLYMAKRIRDQILARNGDSAFFAREKSNFLTSTLTMGIAYSMFESRKRHESAELEKFRGGGNSTPYMYMELSFC